MTKEEKLKQAIIGVFDNSPCFERMEDKEFYINKTFELLSKKHDPVSVNESTQFFTAMLYSLFFKKNWDNMDSNKS